MLVWSWGIRFRTNEMHNRRVQNEKFEIALCNNRGRSAGTHAGGAGIGRDLQRVVPKQRIGLHRPRAGDQHQPDQRQLHVRPRAGGKHDVFAV